MGGVYKLLQSGFICEDHSDLVQLAQEERSLVQAVITQSIFRVDTSNYYDKAISQLHKQMVADSKVFSDFNYRELLLKKAFVVFSKESFIPWFKAQTSSPCYSYLHERYLNETLQFIYNRKPRTMSHSGYARLLHVGADHAIFATGDKEQTTALSHLLSNVDNALTVDMVRQWGNTIEGLQDMLSTMNVIFGHRGGSAA